ncbi:MAG: glycosyltransferase family 2 protein [Phycisphaerales bacterium]
MLIAIIIPVHNEAPFLERTVAQIEAERPPLLGKGLEGSMRADRILVIVDDGSTDGSAAIGKRLGAREGIKFVEHSSNRGKGASLRTGFAAAFREGADMVLLHDADPEYDPEDHETVLRPILDGRADIVFGSRLLGAAHRVLPFWRTVAYRFITMFSNMLTDLNLSDIECCLKAFRREAIEKIVIEEDRHGVDPELAAKSGRLKLKVAGNAEPIPARIFEVPVSYNGRSGVRGKRMSKRAILRNVRAVLKHNWGQK